MTPMESRSDKNWLEWLVFGVGALLVSATVGYLAYDALAVTQSPPKLEVRLGDPAPAPDGYSVPVVVENRGTKAAATVVVRVEDHRNTGEIETAELTLDYVPGEASREGIVVFPGAPDRTTQRTALPVSFQLP